MDMQSKRQQEKDTIAYMIRFYCQKQHHSKVLCPQCHELLEYANKRIDLCPFMETKTFCSACKVHCYEKVKRAQIREVMKYSGMRLLFRKPVMVIRHLMVDLKERKTR